MEQCVKIYVFGRVQGVFYRQSTQIKAKELNIQGFVRNEENGSVYIEAGGAKSDLEAFLRWCHKGPIASKVTEVRTEFVALDLPSGFEIRY